MGIVTIKDKSVTPKYKQIVASIEDAIVKYNYKCVVENFEDYHREMEK